MATLLQDPDEDGHPEEQGQQRQQEEEEEQQRHLTGVLRVQELLSHLSIIGQQLADKKADISSHGDIGNKC